MNLSYLAHDIVARLNLRASFISSKHVLEFAANLHALASSSLDEQKRILEQRKLDILSTYGFNDPEPQTKPFAFSDGIAVIPIHGMLLNRLSWGSSFATGYSWVRGQLNAALADPDVKGIAYDVNSYGGLAAGAGEIAQEIFKARSQKPSLSVVDSNAYSAAYYLASAADRVVVTPSGGVGSIGAVALHADLSDMLDKEGIKLTIVRSRDRKFEGNPYEKLTPKAQQSLQDDVDYHDHLFSTAVSTFRGIPVDDIHKMEAASFLPPDAINNRLVDAVEPPISAMSAFVDSVSSSSGTRATKEPKTVIDPPEPEGDDKGGKGGSKSEEVEMDQAQVSSAVREALAADRKRSADIRNCEEAKGREKFAEYLATGTEMSVEDARSMLAHAPKETESEKPAQGGGSPLDAAMDRTRNPNLSPDAGGGGSGSGSGEEDTPQARADRILSSYGSAVGIKVKPGKVINLRPNAA